MDALDLTVYQWINSILTVIIMIAVVAQALFTHAQARLLRESEQRARDKDRPSIRMTCMNFDTFNKGSSDNSMITSFEGFTVTNVGFIKVEIVSFVFEIGRSHNNEKNDSPTAEITFPPVMQHHQKTVSTIYLPHRLRHGESFRVLYNREMLVEESIRIGGENGIHMRPYCRDSLGNKHMLDYWISYRECNETSFVDGPSPGRVSEEDLNQLTRTKLQRYSRWSLRRIGARYFDSDHAS